ncbi:MAG: aminomethyl-transferring glycine dehydrogenase subunit GcvPB [Planctomycetes bacterium]|nr:aminomethyl-transferring glycine dehydrogenase subunit GcvPB [Planctomycetota bacterium]
MAPTPLIFEMSRPGRPGVRLPGLDVPSRPVESLLAGAALRRAPPALPEVGELEVVRHYTRLSQLNFSIDTNFYPLGSCTMKYNPRVNEKSAALPGFARLHPQTPPEASQGALELLWQTERILAAIAGMDACSLQPAAGAHGEMTGLMVVRAFHSETPQGRKRRLVLAPDSAHGTNPASCTLGGFAYKEIKSNRHGLVDLAELKKHLRDEVACLMITNPNTVGQFEESIEEIAALVHGCGGQVYMDGANMNAIVGAARPGDFGVDVMHLNVHKTFSQPHGGGGPGAGPIAVKKHLEPYLPVPVVARRGDSFVLDSARPKSIGRVRCFAAHFGVYARVYAYLRSLGPEGLRRLSQHAVLNANYIAARLKDTYPLAYDRPCYHECVLTGERFKKYGVRTMDIAKRLIDHGFHPPTVYFPLIVHEAIMIEPTETESRETLDAFCDAMLAIAAEAKAAPEKLHAAPTTRSVGRFDEVTAAREPRLRWRSHDGHPPAPHP